MKGILAILMAGIMMAAMVAPAMSDNVGSTATVNNVVPTAEIDSIANVQPNPCPDNTIFFVTGEVTDENSEADIEYIDYALMNSTGYVFDSGLAANSSINDTAKEFNATITVTCCIPAGEYYVNISVHDNSDNTYWFGPESVTIEATTSIEISNMNFAAGAPGDCVAGNHTVTNKGNGVVQFRNLVAAADGIVCPDCYPLNQSAWDGYDDSNVTSDEIMWTDMTGTAHGKIIEDGRMRIVNVDDPVICLACGDELAVGFNLCLPNVKPDTYTGTTTFMPNVC